MAPHIHMFPTPLHLATLVYPFAFHDLSSTKPAGQTRILAFLDAQAVSDSKQNVQ